MRNQPSQVGATLALHVAAALLGFAVYRRQSLSPPPGKSMLIEVISTGKSTAAQARAYAEYRVFATLVRHSRLIQRVQVLLAPVGGGQGGDLVTCISECFC